MYDRCISVCSSTGSTRPPGCCSGVVVTSSVMQFSLHCDVSDASCPASEDNAARVRASGCSSDVEEANVFGISLDEGAALLDVLAHEDREDLVGVGSVVESHLRQDAVVGVHGCLPQ